MRLTLEQLLRILPEAGKRAAAYLPHLLVAMEKHQINNPKRIAAFLAQIGHESGYLRYAREIWGSTDAQKRYDTRADLGNTPELDGDGKKFLGRGLIQITGRRNYQLVSLILFGDERLLAAPELLEQPEWAAESAAWFWMKEGLNELADRGEFKQITKRINGGLNGYADRLKIWARAREVLAA
jgi:putative chitinase